MKQRCDCGAEQWDYFPAWGKIWGKESKPLLCCDGCGDEYDVEELIDLFLQSGKEPKHSRGWKGDNDQAP